MKMKWYWKARNGQRGNNWSKIKANTYNVGLMYISKRIREIEIKSNIILEERFYFLYEIKYGITNRLKIHAGS